jgi:hypothetical protein
MALASRGRKRVGMRYLDRWVKALERLELSLEP